MKVIGLDNLNREWIDDVLIKENVTLEEGQAICDEHNTENLDYDAYAFFYKVVEDNYKLYVFKH